MPNTFVRITEAELTEKIAEEIGSDRLLNNIDILYMNSKVEKDLARVNFNNENYGGEPDSKDENFLGIHTLENGMPFLGYMAGGDWEIPVAFIVYWDGSDLRAYVPIDGNTYNTSSNEAYGNDEGPDEVNCLEVHGTRDFRAIEWDKAKLLADIQLNILEKVAA